MDVQRVDKRGDLMPAMVTVIIAVVCTAVTLIIDFGPGDGSAGSDNARMITTAAVARAGAIEIPPGPPARRPAT
jgi:hypothetical protein